MARPHGVAIFIATLAVWILLFVTSQLHPRAATGVVTITPTSGPPGTQVGVHVSGFTPSPPTTNGGGDLYPYEILFDGLNFGYPGVHDILGYAHNMVQPFTFPIIIPATVAPGSTHTINYQHTGTDTSADAIFTVSGPAAALVVTAGLPQSIGTGATSAEIRVQVRDSFGTAVRAGSGGLALTLASTSTSGKFFTSASAINTVTTVTVPQDMDATSFFYRDTTAGTPTLTVSRSGLTSASGTITISPPPLTIPAAPAIVTATPLSSSAIHVSWQPSTGATGYDVYSAASAAGPFTMKANTTPVTSPFVVSGLAANNERFFEIKALNSAGASPFSAPVSAITRMAPISGAVTISDKPSCTAMGGTAGLPGVGFVGDTCTISNLTIEAGASVTITGNMTLFVDGGIINYGTINNGRVNAQPGSGDGGILINRTGSTISNTGRIVHNYGSTLINLGTISNWCGATFDRIGAWSMYAPVDQCPLSTIQTATTPSAAVTFSPSAGRFFSLSPVSESSLPGAGKPSGVTFPVGFFSWRVVDLTPGQTITVTMKYASAISASTQFWKVINGGWKNVTSLLGDHDGDDVLTLTIRDNGLEDGDTIPGQITDPGGLALAASGSTWTPVTVLLVVLMALIFLVWLVRRPPTPPPARR